jgi:hypothetical protein
VVGDDLAGSASTTSSRPSLLCNSTVCPIRRVGTEERAEPNRTHDSRSTLGVVTVPMRSRSDGSGPSSSRSAASRSSGTAAISECAWVLTPTHHLCAAAFAAARPVNGACGTSRSPLA